MWDVQERDGVKHTKTHLRWFSQKMTPDLMWPCVRHVHIIIPKCAGLNVKTAQRSISRYTFSFTHRPAFNPRVLPGQRKCKSVQRWGFFFFFFKPSQLEKQLLKKKNHTFSWCSTRFYKSYTKQSTESLIPIFLQIKSSAKFPRVSDWVKHERTSTKKRRTRLTDPSRGKKI